MLTPVQQRIMKLLDDGEPHTKEELRVCLADDLAPVSAVAFHISNLRVILGRKNRGILCDTRSGQVIYRQVMFINPGE